MTEAVIIQKPGFLYDNGLRHERVKEKVSIIIVLQCILLFFFFFQKSYFVDTEAAHRGCYVKKVLLCYVKNVLNSQENSSPGVVLEKRSE